MAATLSDLEQQNPNIRSQIQTWQRERTNNRQNPTDWSAFRQHASGIGAPDPGEEAPPEFMQPAPRAETSAPSGNLGGQSPQQQQPPPQQQQPYQQPPQQQQQPYQQPQQQNPAVLNAIRIKSEYEADKNTPTDKWLKARGMTQAELDAALKLAESA